MHASLTRLVEKVKLDDDDYVSGCFKLTAGVHVDV